MNQDNKDNTEDSLIFLVSIDEHGKHTYSVGDESIGFVMSHEGYYGIDRIMVHKTKIGLWVLVDTIHKGPTFEYERSYFSGEKYRDENWWEVEVWENEIHSKDNTKKCGGKVLLNINKLMPILDKETEYVYTNQDKEELYFIITSGSMLFNE